MTNFALFQDSSADGWLAFRNPERILAATSLAEVLPVLRAVDHASFSEGLQAIGFVSYEASEAFDPANSTKTDTNRLPLCWFALYAESEFHQSIEEIPEFSAELTQKPQDDSQWLPDIPRMQYLDALSEIREHLERGNSYQANFSFRLRCADQMNTRQTFQRLICAHQPSYGAYIESNDFTIFSASPELFFSLNGTDLVCKPMKGTIPRGRTQAEDLQLQEQLQQSEKDRAENVMIVDMIRNDMSKVAANGSVAPSSLFTTEKYPHLWQLTSTIECKTEASIPEIFSALFPCASITGAPKASTMKILSELEDSPREIYTGAIGRIMPGRKALFNVAIRTGWIHHSSGKAEFGIGSGVVWDSVDSLEYEECLLKGAILETQPVTFELFETIRWERGKGFFLIQEHIERLQDSARYFDFCCPSFEQLFESLQALIGDEPSQIMKIRLLLGKNGEVRVEKEEFPAHEALGPVQLVLASGPIQSSSPFLFHKTTNRKVYEEGQDGLDSRQEAVFWNEKNEITETSIANIVVRRNGRLVTPPVSCGLLPGTFRQFLLSQGIIEEEVVSKEELFNADSIYLINSLRGWRKGVVIDALSADKPKIAV